MPKRSRSLLFTLILFVAMPLSALTAHAQLISHPNTSVAPSAAATVLPTGWRLYEQPADGYALSLPPSWRRIDLDPATVAASIDAAGVNDPGLANWLGNQAAALISSQVSLFGFDLDPSSTASGFVTNANVIHSQLPGPVPLQTVVQFSVGELENLPSVQGAINHHPVSVAAGQAEQFNYHMQLGGRALSTTQYIVLRGSDSYVLTLTTPDDQAAGYADSFDQIGASFQIIG